MKTPHTTRLLCGLAALGASHSAPGIAQSLPPVRPSSLAQSSIPLRPNYPLSTVAEVTQGMGGLSLITLNFKNAPLSTVIAEFSRQAGKEIRLGTADGGSYQFRSDGSSKPPSSSRAQVKEKLVTINIDRQPYWLALRILGQVAGYNAVRVGETPRSVPISTLTALPFTSISMLEGPTVSSGPFLLVANSIKRISTQDLKFASAPSTRATKSQEQQVSFTFSSFIDPKLSPDGLPSTLTVEEAVDEKGRQFKILPSYSGYNPGFSRNSTGRQTANLTLPPKVGKRIAKLRGTLSFLQSRKTLTWEVDDILNAQGATKTFEIGGQSVVYTLNQVAKLGNRYEIDITAVPTSTPTANATPGALRYPLSPLGYGAGSMKFRLLDAAGQELSPRGYGSSTGSSQTTFELRFQQGSRVPQPLEAPRTNEAVAGRTRISLQPLQMAAPVAVGEPAKLVLEIPSDLAEIKLPFEFTNLPLP